MLDRRTIRRLERSVAAAATCLLLTGAGAAGAAATTHGAVPLNSSELSAAHARANLGPSTTETLGSHVASRRVSHVLTTSGDGASFPSTGGRFTVRLRNIPGGSTCRLSSGRGVIFHGTYRCGGPLFAHVGIVRANRSAYVKRFTVRVLVRSGPVHRRRAWVVVVGPNVLPATTSSTTSATPVPTPPVPPPSTPANQSSNWSGYALASAPGGTTDVQGTWTVPSLDCTATPDGQVSEWVGVDGLTNSDLFQTGTRSMCAGGVQSNVAWVEQLPDPEYDFNTVTAGDVVAAHIWQVSPGEWQFTLTDQTAGWQETFTQPSAYSGPGTSAEWINEDPSSAASGSLFPLADFATVSFSGVAANQTVPALGPTNAFEMVQGGAALAVPSTFNGAGFTMTYQ
ncbi:MAG TPA: G1 family glutamic endopeptidase [Acidimicrobiales bacterium]|nr:G1 family glutamic endopeptidase [Acidimicrobiales bacterium]